MAKWKEYTAFGETKRWGPWLNDDRCLVRDEECIRSRLRRGWDFERAITEPPQRLGWEGFGKVQSIIAWSEDELNVEGWSAQTICNGLSDNKSIEEILTTERKVFLYTAFGETKGWGEWMRDPRCIIPEGRTIRTRLAADWGFERAISEPYQGLTEYEAFGESKTLAGWTEDGRCVIPYQVLCQRLSRGWGSEEAITTGLYPSRSRGEIAVEDYVRSLGYVVESNVRSIIPPQEIDIYLPEEKVGIEYNGTYWHSSKFRERDYHLEKHLACQEVGVDLLYVWEDDFEDDPDKCLAGLFSALHEAPTSGIIEVGKRRIIPSGLQVLRYHSPQLRSIGLDWDLYSAGEMTVG